MPSTPSGIRGFVGLKSGEAIAMVCAPVVVLMRQIRPSDASATRTTPLVFGRATTPSGRPTSGRSAISVTGLGSPCSLCQHFHTNEELLYAGLERLTKSHLTMSTLQILALPGIAVLVARLMLEDTATNTSFSTSAMPRMPSVGANWCTVTAV